MLQTSRILSAAPRLNDLPEGESVIAQIPPSMIEKDLPQTLEHRHYTRAGGKLFSHEIYEKHETSQYYTRTDVDDLLAEQNTLAELDDVTLTTLTSADILQYNGTVWVNTTFSAAGGTGYLPLAGGTMADGATIKIDNIWARDSDGLGLYDDAGNLGMFIKDGGNVGFGAVTADYQVDVTGGLRVTSTVVFSGVGADTDDTVLILNGSGLVKTDEIDSRVWGSSLVDFTGSPSDNQIATFTDADTIEGDANFVWTGSRMGIGETNPTSYPLQVKGANGLGIQFEDSTNGVRNFLGAYQSVGLLGTLTNHPVAIWANNAARMTILANGNVGIGTALPQKKVHIESSFACLRLSDSDAANDQEVNTLIEFYRGNNTNRVGYLAMDSTSNDIMALATEYAAGILQFRTGSGVAAMTIDASQRVGIGIAAPDTLLHLSSSTPVITLTDTSTGADCLISASNSTGSLFYLADHNNEAANTTHLWYTDGTVKMAMLANGNLGIGTSTPAVDLDVSDAGTNSQAQVFIQGYNDQTAYTPELRIRKSHSDTLGALVSTIDTELLGQIVFSGVDSGNNIDDGAYIRAIQDGAAGVKVPTNIIFATNSSTAINNNQLVLHNDGHVGFGTDAPRTNVTLENAYGIGNRSFSTGWAGSGWDLDLDGAEYTMELDTLWVRGALHVYEMIINQISAVNGGMVISAGNGRVASVSGSPSTEQITFEDPESTTITQFAPGDILLIQNVNLDSSTVVKRIVREVNTTSGMTVTCKALADAPTDAGSIAKGDVVVVIGNTKGGSASANVLSAAQYAGTGGWTGAGSSATITHSYNGGAVHPVCVRIDAGDGTWEGGGCTGLTFGAGKDYIFEFDYKTASSASSVHQIRLDAAGWSNRYNWNFPTSTTWTSIRHVVQNANVSGGGIVDIVAFRIMVNTSSGGHADDAILLDNISIRIAGTVRDASIFMTSTDRYAPYIQVMDEVDTWAAWKDPSKIKAVMGNLEGKYGFEYETSGFAAGDRDEYFLTIDPVGGLRILDGSEGDNVLLQANADLLTVGDNFVYTSSTQVLKVAGWVVAPDYIEHIFDTDKHLRLFIYGGKEAIYYYDASPNSGDVRWVGMGKLHDGSAWTADTGIGMVVYNGATYDKHFWLSDSEKSIAGWQITAATLEKLTANVGVKLDAANAKIQVGDLDEQHIDILGADGTVKWYRSNGAGGDDLVVTIDDSIFSAEPGIKITSSSGDVTYLTDNGLRVYDGGAALAYMVKGTYGGVITAFDSAGGLYFRATYNSSSQTEMRAESLWPTSVAGTVVHWYAANGEIKRYTSSARYKENIVPLEVRSDQIFGLEVKTYTSKSDQVRTFGLIAEEVYEVFPDIVNLDKKGQPDSIREPLLSYMMLEELKKLRGDVDQLINEKEVN